MLFGETLRPLKRGIFHDLMAAHPELDAEELKQAPGVIQPLRWFQSLRRHTEQLHYLVIEEVRTRLVLCSLKLLDQVAHGPAHVDMR